jgi:toxin YoeB
MLAGAWSRHLSEEHRPMDLIDGDDLVIVHARFGYQ